MTARPEAGFTLIEALVSLALGAVVMMSVLTAVKLAGSTASRLAASAATDEALSRFGDLLAGDAAHALALPVTAGGKVFEGSAQAARFAMLPRPRPGETDPDPVFVTYRLGGGTAGHVDRSETPFGQAETDAVAVWEPLQPLAFRYLDARGKWLDRWADPNAMPRALGLVVGPDRSARPALAGSFLPLIALVCTDGASGCADATTGATP